jgi:shikimate kinase
MGASLIFCGIKHCGKSTLGKILARELELPFCDTDELLESQYHAPVRTLFKEWGEEEFRRREALLLAGLESQVPGVISLGGGALLRQENQKTVKKLGTLIWCDIDDRTAFQRIAAGGLPPFLAGEADPFEKFEQNNKERRKIFEACCGLRFVPDPQSSPEENVLYLRSLLREKGVIDK